MNPVRERPLLRSFTMAVTVTNKAAKPAATGKAAQKGKKGFQKGHSGHPQGRPKGSRNKASLIVEQMVDGEAEEIARTLLDDATSGKEYAVKLIFDRVLPRLRSRPITLELPEINAPSDVLEAHKVVLAAVGKGEITPEEAASVLALLDSTQNAIEGVEIAKEVELIKKYVGLEK
jgi:hypothetical protein